MSLSPELEILKQQQTRYQGNTETARKLRDRVLLMVIAPSKVGKSSVIDEVLRLEPYWRNGATKTSRTGRPDDPPEYTTDIPLPRMIEAIHRGDFVNYAVHGTGHIYATLPEGFPAEVTILPTQYGSVESLQNAGFKRAESIFLVTDPNDWRQSLIDANMDKSELRGRLQEGIESIEFALDNADESWLHFVENSRRAAGLHIAAQKVIEIARRHYDQEKREKNIAQAQGMLKIAHELTLEIDKAA